MRFFNEDKMEIADKIIEIIKNKIFIHFVELNIVIPSIKNIIDIGTNVIAFLFLLLFIY